MRPTYPSFFVFYSSGSLQRIRVLCATHMSCVCVLGNYWCCLGTPLPPTNPAAPLSSLILPLLLVLPLAHTSGCFFVDSLLCITQTLVVFDFRHDITTSWCFFTHRHPTSYAQRHDVVWLDSLHLRYGQIRYAVRWPWPSVVGKCREFTP